MGGVSCIEEKMSLGKGHWSWWRMGGGGGCTVEKDEAEATGGGGGLALASRAGRLRR
jgi:hypothetical protein